MTRSRLLDTLTAEQRAAVVIQGVSVALSAGAGCGKTTVLTRRFLDDLAARPAGRLTALTFTEKAARELRGRVREACRARLEQGEDAAHWRAALRGLEAAPIGTFHAFCGRLLRRFPIEAGVAPGFAILEESVAPSLRDGALARCVRVWLAEQDPDLILLAVDFGLSAVRGAIADLISGRSGGELDAWTQRDPAEVVALWQARWETQSRPSLLADLVHGVQPCLDLLGDHQPNHPVMRQRSDFLREHLPGLAGRTVALDLLDEIKANARVQGGGTKAHWPTAEVYEGVKSGLDSLRKAVERVKALLEWDEDATLKAAEQGGRLARLAAGALAAYDREKRAAGLLDFDDLLLKTRDLLREMPGALAAEEHALLVDEFQDTDPIQGEILRRLAGANLGGGRLFLVGDPKQSIYRFRGAQPRIFQDFRVDFPEAGRRSLTENFRSIPAILDFVNALFAETFRDPGEALRPGPGMPARDDHAAVEFLWADEPPLEAAKKPSAHSRRLVEARGIARHLARHLSEGWKIRDPRTGEARNAHGGDVALLFRSLTDVGPYEAALVAQGLDYHVVGGSAYFAQQEVIDLINLLSTIEDPTDALALAGALRSPFFCLSDDGLYWLATSGGGELADHLEHRSRIEGMPGDDRPKLDRAHALLTTWRGLKDRLPMATLLERALDDSGYEAALLGEPLGPRKRANVRKLVRLARRFDLQGGFTLADFVARLRDDLKRPPKEEQAASTEEDGQSVRLMSIHQAKGLEFPIVVLPDLDRKAPHERSAVAFDPDLGPLMRPSRDDEPDGQAPESLGWTIHRLSEARAEADEALRLFYVATTRARDALILSSGSPVDGRPQSAAMALLAERFDRPTGRFLGKLPDGWVPPAVRVAGPPSGTSPGPYTAARSRPRISAILEAIEGVEPADEGAQEREEPRRPKLVDLDPSRALSPASARLDRLVRATLADPSAFQPGAFDEALARAALSDNPAANRRMQHLARERLGPWIDRIGRPLRTATAVLRDVPWSACWPPEDEDTTTFLGRLDLAWRDPEGGWTLVAWSDAEAPDPAERLRVLLSARFLAHEHGGSISRAWRIRLGPGGGVQGEDATDPRALDDAVRAVLTASSQGSS